MSLKFMLEKEEWEGLSDAQRALYKEGDEGKYSLLVEGLPDVNAMKAKVDEFRNNNIELLKRKDELKAQLQKYDGVDPAKYKEAMEKLEKLDDNKLLDAGKIDELVAQKTERMRADYENKITALQEQLAEKEGSLGKTKEALATVKIDNTIQLEINKMGKVKKGAMEDIVARGRRVFQLNDDEEPVALDSRGGVMVGKDGVTPLTIAEWANGLLQEAPHFFEDSTGMGSQGGHGGRDGGAPDFSQYKDPTERLKAIRRHGKGTGARA